MQGQVTGLQVSRVLMRCVHPDLAQELMVRRVNQPTSVLSAKPAMEGQVAGLQVHRYIAQELMVKRVTQPTGVPSTNPAMQDQVGRQVASPQVSQ